MILVRTQTGVVERDLSDLLPGFKVTLRRLTSPELQQIREGVVDKLMAATAGLAVLSDYGLDGPDANGVRLDPADQGQMIRAGILVGQVEVMLAALVSWEGVAVLVDPGDESKGVQLAPITREVLSVLMLDDAISRRLLGEAEAAARLVISEGNASGSSPIGSSAKGPATAAGSTTAETAKPSARRAPRVGRQARAGTVPKS